MVFYRKYRPQTLQELIGQDLVKNTLAETFGSNKLSHAYLFVGPHGTGKTSTARILAKMINCELVITKSRSLAPSLPCNKCTACISITDGSNLDLIEIDAASNRGIDDVRTLRENIKLSPTGKGKKVYIIDEVHMLTQEAFNALLKTLEDPPTHAIFILATTEVGKIPQTILSRVTRLDFKPAKVDDLVKALERVVKGEGLKIEEDALKILAQKADGSFRDVVKLLDQIAASGKVTLENVTDNLAITSFDSSVGFLNFIAKKDGKAALFELNKQVEKGVGVKDLILQLSEVLRAMILIKHDLGDNLVKEDFGSGHYQSLSALADSFQMSDLLNCLDSLQVAFEKLKFASIPSLPLELAVVEICTAAGPAENSRSLGNVSSSKSVPSEDVHIPVARSSLPAAQIESPRATNNSSTDVAILQEKWTFILETIRPYNFSLEALLRSVKIQSCNNGLVILEVPYSFHQRILESPKSKDLLESVLSEVLGKAVKVNTVLGQRSQSVEELANVEVAADDEVIRLASEIFNGKLVD